jgi:enoyl-CoA hydratase/carnithine racemase
VDLQSTRYRITDRSAVITLHRPERGNAWTGRMHAEYKHCLVRAERNASVRTIVVTGEGWAFCVGGDAEALNDHGRRGGYDDGLTDAGDKAAPLSELASAVSPDFDGEFAYHFALTKPVIAAINGPAAGIGLALACFADLRFAVPGAALTSAHGRLALPPEYGLSWLLPRQIGLSRAMELLMTSRRFLTDEAHELGLVSRLVPPDELLQHTLGFAHTLASTNSAGALAATRHMVYLDQTRAIASSVEESRRRLASMMGRADYRQGVEALIDNREPEF